MTDLNTLLADAPSDQPITVLPDGSAFFVGEIADAPVCKTEEEAWRKVAEDAFKQLDAYLRSVDPTLPAHYGMPVDGVRYVIERLKKGD